MPVSTGYNLDIPLQISAGPVTQVGTASSYFKTAIRIE
jgi:hypothetical protein